MNDKSKIKELLQSAWVERREGNYDKARILLKEAHQICDDNDFNYLGRIYHIYAQFESDHNRPHEALKLCKQSLDHYKNEGNADRIAHSTRHIADLERRLKNYDDAELKYREVIRIYKSESSTSSLDLANALRGFALVLENQEKFEKSKTIWKEAKEIYQTCNIKAGVDEANVHLNKINIVRKKPSIIHIDEIKSILDSIDVISAMEQGFIQYSNGNSVVPPVGELLFKDPPGDVHIKYGYIKNDDFYVIKIASGFYENNKLGIPSGQGLMLLFNQKTGELVAVLLDEGHLTDIRTAAAGALAAKYFASKEFDAVGIIGTGIQAKLQLQYLQKNNPCRTVWIWGRNQDHAEQMKQELGDEYDITIASSCAEVAKHSNVIFTTTPSEEPLLKAIDVQPGTLIIAVGSDTKDKQELESQVLQNADLVIADSIPQSKSRGEIYRAVKGEAISESKVIELGTAIQQPHLQRTYNEQLIVVDLTGVAVQDIMIASAVYHQYAKPEL